MRSLAIVAIVGTLSTGAIAQCVTQFELQASPGDALGFNLSIPLVGTFIGNYDAVNNPTGTQTRPNLSGGSGNNPIAFSSVVSPDATIEFPQGVPVFTFCVEDLGDGTATVTCTTLDLIRGSPAPITIGLTITYPNFHTVSPFGIFIGVNNLTLPIPAGEITQANAVQSKPTIGALVPGPGGSLILTALIPADITFEATVLGQTIPGTPTPITLPIVAELLPTLTGDYVAVVALELPETVIDFPAPTQGVVDQPFDLPTILPPGGTAHLLVSGMFGAGSITFGMSASLSGDGSTSGPLGDLNGDCIVNGADLGILLAGWGGRGAADLNNDGIVNGADLGLLLGNWS